MNDQTERHGFERYPDLASRRLGATVVAFNDEFFAPADNLIDPSAPVFDPERYTDRGKWMDGWETRRRRSAGHDWCVIALATRGVPQGVIIDTSHFRGNHPEAASLEVIDAVGRAREAVDLDRAPWTEVLPRQTLAPHHRNGFPIVESEACTHLRLNIYPDGGVARLRLHARVTPEWEALAASDEIDVASVLNGGRILGCSDAFFSRPENLLIPGPAIGMHDGWETRRRRGPGHDWVVVELGRRSRLERLEISTRYFKGNYPAACSVDAWDAGARSDSDDLPPDDVWMPWLPSSDLGPDAIHRFEAPRLAPRVATHLRLQIYPDGGVARLRAFGSVDP